MSIHVNPADLGSGTTKTTTDDDEDSDSNDSVFSTSSSLDEDSMPYDEQKQYEVRDIYLGGSCALRTKWRREIALPYLKEKQVTFYMPTLHENLSLKQIKRLQSNPDDSLTVQELTGDDIGSLMYNPRILDFSRVLLFVITNETRSLAPMTLAAHYIGRGYNVVLCIQTLPEDCTIGNDKVKMRICCAKHEANYLDLQLTPSAIKDYNRGRSYLRDLAMRQNIPVFDDIKEALQEAVEKVKFSKPRCSV
jgi:hypothetical protein